MTDKENETLPIATIQELRDWLESNHHRPTSIWLVTWKKDSGKPYVPYSDIVDECLCFGWIDSLPRKLDSQRTMLRISPRNPKSNWSGVNKRKILELEKQGRIRGSGRKLIEWAKQNGAWDFLNDVEALIVPDDLQSALEAEPEAREYFDRFPASSRRGILEWIKTAKSSETRERRIRETATKAGKNIKANHPKGRDQGPSK